MLQLDKLQQLEKDKAELKEELNQKDFVIDRLIENIEGHLHDKNRIVNTIMLGYEHAQKT